MPGFVPLPHGGPSVFGAQQLGPGVYGGYGAQQPVRGAYGGQPLQGGQPGYGQQPPTSEDQPGNSGTTGYGNSGYGSGPVSTPQFCVPYGGFGPVQFPGGYYGGPHGGFGGQMQRSFGHYGSFWKKLEGFRKYGGGFGGKYGYYPFSDYQASPLNIIISIIPFGPGHVW